MKSNLLKVVLLFITILGVISGLFFWQITKKYNSEDKKNNLVLLEEIKTITSDENGENIAREQLDILIGQEKDKIYSEKTDFIKLIVIFTFLCICYVVTVVLYIYVKIIRPFYELEEYAGELAKGNFDVSLPYKRKNFFGAFTWAFDHMKEEIKIARKKEKEAISENKLIIAALSHDIKTPIASVRAYAEALEAGIDDNYERGQIYVSTIMKKCDEVTKLTNDLVLHSLSELEKLEIQNSECSIDTLLGEIVNDLNYTLLEVQYPIEPAFIYADEKRVAQVIENILNNSKKYAKDCRVIMHTTIQEDKYCIFIRDYGKGIPNKDLPFIFEKFYRGKNAKNIDGSGLGLYIVRYIMEKMEGNVELRNSNNGLEVVLMFKLVQ